VKQGGAWANKTEIEEIKADVSQHLVSTQVRVGLMHSRRLARGGGHGGVHWLNVNPYPRKRPLSGKR
jgi:hypothetical protein